MCFFYLPFYVSTTLKSLVCIRIKTLFKRSLVFSKSKLPKNVFFELTLQKKNHGLKHIIWAQEKALFQKCYCGHIEHLWLSLWNVFLSFIGLTGIDISEENSKIFRKIDFSKSFLNLKNSSKKSIFLTYAHVSARI